MRSSATRKRIRTPRSQNENGRIMPKRGKENSPVPHRGTPLHRALTPNPAAIHRLRASNTRKPSAISMLDFPNAPKRPPFQCFSTRYTLLHLVTPKFFKKSFRQTPGRISIFYEHRNFETLGGTGAVGLSRWAPRPTWFRMLTSKKRNAPTRQTRPKSPCICALQSYLLTPCRARPTAK